MTIEQDNLNVKKEVLEQFCKIESKIEGLLIMYHPRFSLAILSSIITRICNEENISEEEFQSSLGKCFKVVSKEASMQ